MSLMDFMGGVGAAGEKIGIAELAAQADQMKQMRAQEHAEMLQGRSQQFQAGENVANREHATALQKGGFTHAENLQAAGLKHAETQQTALIGANRDLQTDRLASEELEHEADRASHEKIAGASAGIASKSPAASSSSESR